MLFLPRRVPFPQDPQPSHHPHTCFRTFQKFIKDSRTLICWGEGNEAKNKDSLLAAALLPDTIQLLSEGWVQIWGHSG